MIFQSRYDYQNVKDDFNFSNVIEIAINNAGDYEFGQLELLEARIRIITTILVMTANNLPDNTKVELAQYLGYEVKVG